MFTYGGKVHLTTFYENHAMEGVGKHTETIFTDGYIKTRGKLCCLLLLLL